MMLYAALIEPFVEYGFMRRALVACLALALGAHPARAEVVSGHIRTTEPTAFLAKFCYVHTGTMHDALSRAPLLLRRFAPFFALFRVDM